MADSNVNFPPTPSPVRGVSAEDMEAAVIQVKADLEGQMSEISVDPSFNASSETETATLGPELIDGNGWTSTGWTGDLAAGFKNTVGQTQPLTKMLPSTGTKLYQVSFRVESPTPAGVPNASTDFTVTLGNSVPFVTYKGGGNFNYTFGIQSVSDGVLSFNPGVTFDGTIKNISVKEIVGTVKPSLEIKGVSNNNVLEFRTSKPELLNIHIGKNSGKSATTGDENVSLGDLSLVKNTTGHWNTALGAQTLQNNTVGSRNVAVGRLALRDNISGDRNIAIGTYTLMRNTTGRQNIAMGADALWVNTTGSRNIVLGMGGMGENTIGNENIAIGYVTLEKNVSGNNNIALGQESLLSNVAGSDNVAIGRESLKNAVSTGVNIAIGLASLSGNTTGSSNTAVGRSAMLANKTGSENVALGHYAAASGVAGDLAQNVIIGAWSGNLLTTGGNNNTLIGYGSGRNLTTGNNNILIGRNIDGSSATVSGEINIGGVFKSNIFTKRATIGTTIANPTATFHLPAGSAAAQSAPIKLTSGPVMTTPENGAFEYDGINYYLTVGGVRKIVQLV